MRPSPSVTTLATAIALLVLPAALHGQATTPTPAATRPPGCRGTNTQTSATTLTRLSGGEVTFPSYGEIESVQPGSPAEMGGMKARDVVLAQNGRDLVANPPEHPALAGDTVVFLVRRDGVEIPLTVVLGRWDPPQEAEGVTRVCRPLAAGATGG